MIETSLSLSRKSSAVFSNLQKFLENVRQYSGGLRTSFGDSLESGRKYADIRQNCRRQYVYLRGRT